ncbi:hypothetical protein B0T17DRAFT_518058 [Bombardia bombarda]|uniref:Cyanovirin-N domain-containing protein n=1 Tax=Bombardia bombarda TaxID=252184 RepID=A0AA40CFY9_9PEZI|nr:hypothetical protein B0T17DRAFT_518058 [Bombardia bombarda]
MRATQVLALALLGDLGICSEHSPSPSVTNHVASADGFLSVMHASNPDQDFTFYYPPIPVPSYYSWPTHRLAGTSIRPLPQSTGRLQGTGLAMISQPTQQFRGTVSRATPQPTGPFRGTGRPVISQSTQRFRISMSQPMTPGQTRGTMAIVPLPVTRSKFSMPAFFTQKTQPVQGTNHPVMSQKPQSTETRWPLAVGTGFYSWTTPGRTGGTAVRPNPPQQTLVSQAPLPLTRTGFAVPPIVTGTHTNHQLPVTRAPRLSQPTAFQSQFPSPTAPGQMPTASRSQATDKAKQSVVPPRYSVFPPPPPPPHLMSRLSSKSRKAKTKTGSPKSTSANGIAATITALPSPSFSFPGSFPAPPSFPPAQFPTFKPWTPPNPFWPPTPPPFTPPTSKKKTTTSPTSTVPQLVKTTGGAIVKRSPADQVVLGNPAIYIPPPDRPIPSARPPVHSHIARAGDLSDIELATQEPPPPLVERCLYLQVGLELDKDRRPSKKAYLQAACRMANPTDQQWNWRCSKLNIANCFANKDGVLVPTSDNAGKWTDSCTDCTYDGKSHKIFCTCWKKDNSPNITEISLDSGIWSINGMLHCGRHSKGTEIDLNKCPFN